LVRASASLREGISRQPVFRLGLGDDDDTLQVPVNMSFRTANFRTSGVSAAGGTRAAKDLSGQAKGLKAKYPEREGNLRLFRNLIK